MLDLSFNSPVCDALFTVRQLFCLDNSFETYVLGELSAHTPLTVKQSTVRKRGKEKKTIDLKSRNKSRWTLQHALTGVHNLLCVKAAAVTT